jgi:hypothetical protein
MHFKPLAGRRSRPIFSTDRLSVDRAKDSELNSAMFKRIAALAEYFGCRRRRIVYTCSAFGDAIEAVATCQDRSSPKAERSHVRRCASTRHQYRNAGNLERSVASMEKEFKTSPLARGVDARIRTVCVHQPWPHYRPVTMSATTRCWRKRRRTRRMRCRHALAQFSTSVAMPAVLRRPRLPSIDQPGQRRLQVEGTAATVTRGGYRATRRSEFGFSLRNARIK